MAEITLVAEVGRPTGTGPAKRLRAEGRIPGVVYGRGTDALPVSVEWRALRQALTTEQGLNALINLQVDGERKLSIVKELQRHPVKHTVLHVDFLLIDRDVDIEVEVPIVLEGEATEVLNNEGVVEQVLNVLHVRTKPGNIPAHITVDISALELNHTVTIGDLVLPEGVATDLDPERPVVTGKPVRLELEEEAPEGEEGEGEAAEGEGAEGETPEGPADRGAAAEAGELPQDGDEG